MKEKITAEFIGEDGSMGLIKGKIYKMFSSTNGDLIHIAILTRKNSYKDAIRCPYSNLHTFLANWRVIQ